MEYRVHVGFDVSPDDATLLIVLYDLLMKQKPGATDDLSTVTLEYYFALLDPLLDALPDVVEGMQRYTGFDVAELARIQKRVQEQIQRSRDRLAR